MDLVIVLCVFVCVLNISACKTKPVGCLNKLKLIRKNPPNSVILAMKSTAKQTLSFQETTRLKEAALLSG